MSSIGQGKLVIVSAPSGAGKSTIVTHLLNQGLNLEFSVSATTRKPRGKEKNGKEYYFISAEDFKNKIKNNEFVEWEEVYRNSFYGTLKSEIERIWRGKKHVLFDVDVKGGIKLKNIFGNKAISIFIMPPSLEEIEKRLLRRGTDDEKKIKLRVQKASDEIKFASEFDKVIINDNLDYAFAEVYETVNSFLNN